mgnify:CR=1 FL=1|tara:strand:- start:264 stop:554 length:291 start_codon:yes stop_codon:yes gene_type:complete
MTINKNGEPFSVEYQAYYDKRTIEFSDGTKALESLRAVRNQKLKETDFYALADVTMSDDMKTYRQQLRDLPKDYITTDGKDLANDLVNLDMPIKPE